MTDQARKYLSDIQICIEKIEKFMLGVDTYDGMDNTIIWAILQNHIPPLKQQVEQLLF